MVAPWYIKMILFFKPIDCAISENKKDGWVTKVFFKSFRGYQYIVKRESYSPPPTHFNCRCKVTESE